MLNIYSVYDSKAEAFIAPFYCPTIGLAVRSFETACRDEGHNFHIYAADYTLFELGSFDESKGTFVIHKTPTNLGLALTYIAVQPLMQPGNGVKIERSENETPSQPSTSTLL